MMAHEFEVVVDNQIALLIRVNSLRQQDAFLAAIAMCHKAREGAGEDPDLLAMIAECYYALAVGNPAETGDNYQSAIEWIGKAIALRPDDARLHACLAEFLWLGNPDYKQAAQEFRKAISLAPNRVATLSAAAALYGTPEDVVTLEEATGWLERAALLEPDDPNLYARLGDLYEQAGRSQEAKQAWRRALLCPRPLAPGYVQAVAQALVSDTT